MTAPREERSLPALAHLWEALLDGLRERGYREGQNLVFERRFSEGHAERFPVPLPGGKADLEPGRLPDGYRIGMFHVVRISFTFAM